MDEKKGRRVAANRNIATIGTLGLVERAAKLKMLDFTAAIGKLKLSGFYISETLEADFLRRFSETD